MLRIYFCCAFFLLQQGCGASPGSRPGLCKRSCTGARIAPVEGRFTLMSEASLTLECTGMKSGEKYPRVVPLRFLIEKELSSAVSTPKAMAVTEEEESTTDAKEYEPQAGIQFEALIVSGMTSDDNPDPAATPSVRYNGIMTPSEEWCTDTCGVGAIDLQPKCFDQEHTIRVLLKSGAIYTTVAILMKEITATTTVQ